MGISGISFFKNKVHLEDKIESYLWMVRLKSIEEEFQLTSYSRGNRYFEESPAFDNIASEHFKNLFFSANKTFSHSE